MTPINIILLNIIIGLVIPIIILKCYIKSDMNYYRCSTPTHIFGIILPVTNIILISMLLDKHNNLCNIHTGLKILVLLLSYSMFYFHLIYHLEKEGIIKN